MEMPQNYVQPLTLGTLQANNAAEDCRYIYMGGYAHCKESLTLGDKMQRELDFPVYQVRASLQGTRCKESWTFLFIRLGPHFRGQDAKRVGLSCLSG